MAVYKYLVVVVVWTQGQCQSHLMYFVQTKKYKISRSKHMHLNLFNAFKINLRFDQNSSQTLQCLYLKIQGEGSIWGQTLKIGVQSAHYHTAMNIFDIKQWKSFQKLRLSRVQKDGDDSNFFSNTAPFFVQPQALNQF